MQTGRWPSPALFSHDSSKQQQQQQQQQQHRQFLAQQMFNTNHLHNREAGFSTSGGALIPLCHNQNKAMNLTQEGLLPVTAAAPPRYPFHPAIFRHEMVAQ